MVIIYLDQPQDYAGSTHSKIELPEVAPDIDKNTGFSISRLIQDAMSVAHFNLKDHVVKKNLNDRDGFPLKLPDSTKSRQIYKPYSTDYRIDQPGIDPEMADLIIRSDGLVHQIKGLSSKLVRDLQWW